MTATAAPISETTVCATTANRLVVARRPFTCAIVALVAASLLTAACASTPKRTGPGGPPAAEQGHGRSNAMVSGDDSGLGISGAETPPELRAIVAAPYVLPTPPDCAAVAHEIAGLDDLLGPDVDAPPPAKADLEHSAGQAFGSAVRGAIPYRWVLRWMTQAGRLDRELREAVLAGTARRGFLKGVQKGLACPAPPKVATR
jgi:hypothetical protein